MTKDELYKAAFDSIIDSEEDQALELVGEAESMGLDLVDLLSNGFGAGIKQLGEDFASGDVFLPELMMAAEVMKAVSAEIEGKIDTKDQGKKCVMVIGTVAGDVHDIGKGIVASLVKSNGIEVHDLGREVPAADFIAKAKEVNADFIGSSALLTTTMTEQKEIEKLLEQEGLKGKIKTMVGGAPVTQRWADRIKADYYCEDANESVKAVLEYLQQMGH